jgi:predicted small lipoprotein YifL
MQRSDWYFLITLATLLVLSLTGCSRKTPVEQAFQGVDERITAIDRALTPECRTEDVMRTIDAVRHEVMVARVSCETKIEEYKTKYNVAKNAFLGLFFMILAIFFIKSKKIF